jgi:hypothetical protein
VAVSAGGHISGRTLEEKGFEVHLFFALSEAAERAEVHALVGPEVANERLTLRHVDIASSNLPTWFAESGER